MPPQLDLKSLLLPATNVNTPTVLIYCVKPSERLNYVCEFIFNTVLHIRYCITSNFNEFENFKQAKINYSHQDSDIGINITPHTLIFDDQIFDVMPQPTFKNEFIYFFIPEAPPRQNAFHFDIFSSVFYFISRNEEWQKFEKDKHHRFEAAASILFQSKFHLIPVVDYWILELKAALQTAYPELQFPSKQFKTISTIDVDNLYAYQSKGVFRTLGGALKDILKCDFKNLVQRIKVVNGHEKDPFDIYESVSQFCFKLQIPLIYFFLFKTGTQYDRTVNPKSGAFKRVFNLVKNNHAFIGIHPSYQSAFKNNVLRDELKSMHRQWKDKISLSRQHYLRFDIRNTPNLLLQNGIDVDFTMGYASSPGFRAGTSHPFYYYNFAKEKKTDLLFVPFCAMDGAYLVYEKVDAEKTYQSLINLALEVKKAQGFFITVFHERTFSNHLYPNFGTLYKKLHQQLKEF
jgi:hypothetical protein